MTTDEVRDATWALTQALRRTVVFACIMGAGVVILCLAVFPPFSAVGVVIGLAGGWYNLRWLDKAVGNVDIEPEESTKQLRAKVRGKVLGRLAILTAGVVALVILYPPLGFGALAGLVVFQFSFIVNLGRAALAAGGTE